ncbi:hypothetical protein O159_23990 [Leifsonia xyli subsp. cynodontis DSM 46306]|uniref:LamG-like jellyroll fold domain-containing protein n=1 Tax=Leifsonia xyli subsp. cynodontis DSM 46306 TaxID=1389489 RepID=U3P966_LEIXC|nr:hypothetical protein O159_23990 [Leifsonia xyli subsp. cynodontis DSM 46306]
MAALVVCAGLVAVDVPVGAAVEQSAGVVDADHAADEVSARAVAEAYGHDVVVDSQSSPNLLVKVRADGLMEAVTSQVPEQAKVKGKWTTLDTTLVEEDEWFEPKVAAVPVRIGRGGTDQIVSVRSVSGEWITETWPYGDLPVPTVKKNAAVFKDVLPGVNLWVTATKAGMREVLVVKNAEAAADERLSALRLTVTGARLVESAETGALEAHPAEGEPVLAATPLWWDSSHEAASEESPGGSEPRAVASSVSGAESVLDIGAITDGDVTYPLYVDPDWSGYLQYDWYTDRAYPNQSYLNPPENSAGYGVQGGVGYLSRAFYRFDTSFLAGKAIQNARFNVVQTWANSCASTWMQLWQYGPSGVGFTWNSDPGQWVRAIDGQAYNVGGPCQRDPQWVGFSATVAIQDAAAAGLPYQTLALRAENEGSSLTGKHYRWDAQLIVTYNSRPNTPAAPAFTAPARSCSTDANNPVYVYGGAPVTIGVTVTDPDPQNTAAIFTITRLSNGVQDVPGTAFQAQGANLTYTIPANCLVDGEKYAWSAVGFDTINYSAASPRCYFVADSTKPALPTVSVDAVGATVGSPLDVVVTAAEPAIAGYQVWWTNGGRPVMSPAAPVTSYTSALPDCGLGQAGAVRVVCADPSGRTTIRVAPVEDLSTLWVAAYDRAGNVSYDSVSKASAAGLEVRAELPDLSTGHVWSADDVDAMTLTDRVGAASIPVGGNAGWASADGEDPQLRFLGMVSLNGYAKPGGGHATEKDAASLPGFVLESTIGQLARYGSGAVQPSGTQVLYACAYGAGNMLSRAANCDGAGPTGRPLGYVWASASALPAGYTAVEIFRCRVGNDYFTTTTSACPSGAVNEGSRGFLAKYQPTATAPGVVDTTKSFTVSARVKTSGQTEAQAVVSGSGVSDSGFSLQAGMNWQFCLRAQGPTAVTKCVTGPAVSTTPGFVTVSGVWDAVNRQLGIVVYADDVLTVNRVFFSLPVDDVPALGAVVVGSALTGGIPTQFFDGAVADVSVYPAALPDSTLRQRPVPQP